jgi:hypothetical protein
VRQKRERSREGAFLFATWEKDKGIEYEEDTVLKGYLGEEGKGGLECRAYGARRLRRLRPQRLRAGLTSGAPYGARKERRFTSSPYGLGSGRKVLRNWDGNVTGTLYAGWDGMGRMEEVQECGFG